MTSGLLKMACRPGASVGRTARRRRRGVLIVIVGVGEGEGGIVVGEDMVGKFAMRREETGERFRVEFETLWRCLSYEI
jgi:hypothetical protein